MERAQLATLPFLAGAALGAGAAWWLLRAERRSSDEDSAQPSMANGGAYDACLEMAPLGGAHAADARTSCAAMSRFDEDEVLTEQLTRNVQFFGLESQKQIAGSFVVVVGLGVSLLGCPPPPPSLHCLFHS